MLSYHRCPPPPREKKHEFARFFTPGFQTVDTNDPTRVAQGLTKFVCAPGVFREGYRCKKNFMFADWIGLDFDEGDMTLSQAVENVFCDMTHVIGITMSHQTEPEWRDKFRVMIPLDRRIEDIRLYEHQLKLAGKKYPLDTKCLEGARFFYPCREIISLNPDGYTWEIDDDLPPAPDYAARNAARVKHGTTPPWVYSALSTKWMDRTKNDTCYKLGAALGILGYSPEEITEMILKSPTYEGKAAPTKEIFESVSNGVERGLRELPDNFKTEEADYG